MKNINNNIKICFFVLVVLFCIGAVTWVSMDLLTHSPREQEDKINNIYDVNVTTRDNFVFLGDSLTELYPLDEFYEDIPVVNSGTGGYTTVDILNNLKEKVYCYNPTKVFLQIGINDLAQERPVDEIFDNILKIVKEIQKNRPYAKIYVESLYPVNDSDNEKINRHSLEHRSNEDINEINSRLKKQYENTDVTYIDVHKALRGDDGKLKLSYTEEGVHLTLLAYLKITKTLLPYLQD